MTIATDGAKLGNWIYFIDAKTGKILHKFNGMPNAVGYGVSNYSDTVQINTKWTTSTYEMIDTVRLIKTYTANGQQVYPGTLITDSDNFWDQNKSAVDVHWGLSMVYNFYKNIFNRPSFDSSSSEIRATVQYKYGNDPNNSYWNGVQFLFGEGDGMTYSPLTSLDCCGHEFTHSVANFEYGADEVYYGEYGALNESLSDIFGTAIEFYVKDTSANWSCGEEWYTPNIPGDAYRFMNNPGSPLVPYQQPDTYYGTYWCPTDSSWDNGGVHINSGVLNFAFYLMTVGGSGTNDYNENYNVTGIGIDKTRAIAYRALTVYLNQSTDFLAAADAFYSAACDLYGSSSAECQTIINAFGAVGLRCYITVKNSYNAGYIVVNGTVVSNGYSYYTMLGTQQTHQAISPYYNNPYNYVWNTSGTASSKSNWGKQLSGQKPVNIPGATNISRTFIASESDWDATFIADLKKVCNITLPSGIRIDGGNSGTYKVNGINIGTSYTSTIVEGNSITIEAIPSSSDIFYQWSDGIISNPRIITPFVHTSVTAQYKAIHRSNDAAAFNTSQRKLIQTSAGGNCRWLHQVYTSAGHVWIEHSGNGGSTWTLGNNGQPLDGTAGGKCPSIDWVHYYYYNSSQGTYVHEHIIVATYQQKFGNYYKIRYAVFKKVNDVYVNNTPGGSDATLHTESSDLYSVDANPNIAINGCLSGIYDFVISFERKSGSTAGVNCFYGKMSCVGIYPTYQNYVGPVWIDRTNASSVNASVHLNKGIVNPGESFDIVYQQGNQYI